MISVERCRRNASSNAKAPPVPAATVSPVLIASI
jgi:hypothetical protein